ncbi:unnamed protein product [Moneuplotes crassus]|uniref:Uncharacterized protein n=1 Tax=Euplotes crassus TaxID=5936 RepID=A0AAD1UH98_EUPCR|nr:unnamed protein product [Moneuplotes crassus]
MILLNVILLIKLYPQCANMGIATYSLKYKTDRFIRSLNTYSMNNLYEIS